MNKSDKLDELRLEVGMVAEKMETLENFYAGIIETIGRQTPSYFAAAIYLCDNYFYSLTNGVGKISENKFVKFGDGTFSICSIRGNITLSIEKGIQRAYAPFYNGHHLIGILLFECPVLSYEVTDEDLIFLEEITRFIEIKSRQYQNDNAIDN